MRRRTESEAGEALYVQGPNPFEGDRQFVTALYRGLEILRAFRPTDEEGLGNLELSQRTGLGPSTVSRLTYTLTRLGYLRYDRRSGRYRLGVSVLGLGYTCLAGLGIRAIAQPRLQAVADRVGSGVQISLSAREGAEMTYIASAKGPDVLTMQLDIGSRVSLLRSGAGRALLAGLPDEQRENTIAALGALERSEKGLDAEGWQRLEAEIRQAIDEVRRRGYCVSIGSWRPEVNTIAAPVYSADDDGMVYGLTIGGLSHYLPRERLEAEMAPLLLELTRSLSTGVPRKA